MDVVTVPSPLQPGDSVMVLSPSWGGPAAFPDVHECGLTVLREDFGLTVHEHPSTRWSPERLFADPKARAQALMDAFFDRQIKAVFAAIGGDDAVRLLPHLDLSRMARTGTVFMGYSDTTAILAPLVLAGSVAYHGPSVMAGFAQMRNLPDAFFRHVRQILFEPWAGHTYLPYGQYSEGYISWDEQSDRPKEAHVDRAGPRWLQGGVTARGRLWGGCVEVLQMLQGTRWWPAANVLSGAILCFETSEEAPSPDVVKRWLRSLGVQGILDAISGVLVGRPCGYDDAMKAELDRVVQAVVAEEFGRTDLPIVTNLDFGHTDPQWVLPLGAILEIDVVAETLTLMPEPKR